MKRLLLIFHVIMVLVLISVGTLISQTQTKNDQKKPAGAVFQLYEPFTYKDMPYRLMKPLDLATEISYPVIVSLHGGGGRGNDNRKQIKAWTRQLADAKVRKEYPCYVIA